MPRFILWLDEKMHRFSWWTHTYIGKMVCDQADYYITGMEDTRRW